MRRLGKLLVALGLMGVVLGLPLAISASHGFLDVPDSSVFHEDIDWLADAGITRGCNPPDNTEFCPSDPVTREQMAAFMRRLATGNVVDAASLGGQQPSAFDTFVVGANGAPDDESFEIAAVSFTAPAAGGMTVTGALEADWADDTNPTGFSTMIIWALLNGQCGNILNNPSPPGLIIGSVAAGEVAQAGPIVSTIAFAAATDVDAGANRLVLCGGVVGDDTLVRGGVTGTVSPSQNNVFNVTDVAPLSEVRDEILGSGAKLRPASGGPAG